ncbi:MAG: FxsA family protein [Gammaproteobacteria bacterium]|nr:FxsA family protein [Gammaproteobacteria bacterium]
MLRIWPLLFFVIPLIEIYFLVQVGEEIGAGMTVLLVIITAAIGVSLLKQQGLRTLMKANQAMQAGQMPAQEMFDGFLLAVVGVLLVTPGFFTDAMGFLLLIPAVRKILLQTLLKNIVMQAGAFHSSAPGNKANQQTSDADPAVARRTIEGDYKRED